MANTQAIQKKMGDMVVAVAVTVAVGLEDEEDAEVDQEVERCDQADQVEVAARAGVFLGGDGVVEDAVQDAG